MNIFSADEKILWKSENFREIFENFKKLKSIFGKKINFDKLLTNLFTKN
jgi:hypothetical protein